MKNDREFIERGSVNARGSMNGTNRVGQRRWSFFFFLALSLYNIRSDYCQIFRSVVEMFFPRTARRNSEWCGFRAHAA